MSDFSVLISIIIMVGVDKFFNVPTAKLNVPQEFRVSRLLSNTLLFYVVTQPTWSGRGWVVNPFTNPVWTWFAAILPALFAVILYFMDQQVMWSHSQNFTSRYRLPPSLSTVRRTS